MIRAALQCAPHCSPRRIAARAGRPACAGLAVRAGRAGSAPLVLPLRLSALELLEHGLAALLQVPVRELLGVG